jgi:virginiamycin B lyase
MTPSGAVIEFAIPTVSSGPEGITAGPDGNLWFVERTADKIARITPAGQIAEYAVPTPGSEPLGVTVGPDGRIWFTEQQGNQLGRFTFQATTPTPTRTPGTPLPTPTSPARGRVTPIFPPTPISNVSGRQ